MIDERRAIMDRAGRARQAWSGSDDFRNEKKSGTTDFEE